MLACPLQGKLCDVTGEYTWTFVMSGTMATTGGCLMLAIVPVVYCRLVQYHLHIQKYASPS